MSEKHNQKNRPAAGWICIWRPKEQKKKPGQTEREHRNLKNLQNTEEHQENYQVGVVSFLKSMSRLFNY